MTREDKIARWELLKTTELMVQKTIDECGYDPLELSFGSHKKAWFKCSECGYRWLSIIKNRSKGQGCLDCCNRNRSNNQREISNKGKKLLFETHPELCGELKFKEDGYKYTQGSNTKILWKCITCKDEWYATIYNRISRGSGCPFCSGFRSSSRTCISVTNSDLCKELKYKEDGLKYSKGSNKKVWWVCSYCGYEWRSNIYSRTSGCGCPECSKKNHSEVCLKRSNKGKKLLYETNSELCKELIDVELSYKHNKNSTNKVFWKCKKCGYVWKARITDRVVRGLGCAACANKVVTVNNCIATTNPELCEELKYKEDAYKYTCGSGKKVWWKCSKCSRECKSSVSDKNRGHGCTCIRKGTVIGEKEQNFINKFVKKVNKFSFKRNKKGLYEGQQYTVPFLKQVNNYRMAFIDFAIKYPKLSRIFLLEYDEDHHRYIIDHDIRRQAEVYKKLKFKYDQVSIIRVSEYNEDRLEFVINEFYKFLNDKDYKEIVEYPKDIWN